MNKITYKFALLLCFLTLAVSVFAASEAEYKKLEKTYTLRPDGSQDFRCNMELTLFTHTAMNGTYGESFIIYNPKYQELKINSSYTKQKDGNIIKTPDNAFVEVLPGSASDAPAYNHLKEMVVVHTGLELGATIYLDYTVISKPGYLPELDIFEELLQTSPVKEYAITISLPEGKQLSCTQHPGSTKPTRTTSDGVQQVSWIFRNLPAASRDPFISVANGDQPFLAASTYASEGEALKSLYKQFNPVSDAQVSTVAEALTEGKTTDTEKLQAIHRYITENLGNCRLSLEETGYTIRQADAVINSAYGTAAEKINLLSGMLNALGIKAEATALFRVNANQGGCGLSAVEELVVIADADGKCYLLSPVQNTMTATGWRNNLTPAISLSSGQKMEIDAPASEINYNVVLNITPDKADAKVTATIGSAFLPSYGNYLSRYAGNDKDVKEVKEKNKTTLSFSSSQPLEARNGYVMVALSDAPVSLSHSPYCNLNSTRKDNLLIPYRVDENYIYVIQIPEGMDLCTPESVKTTENAAGKITISLKKNGNTAEAIRSLKLNKQLYTPAEYRDLRTLLTEWGNANNKLLLFSAEKVTK